MKKLDLNIASELQREPVSQKETINLTDDNSKINGLLKTTIDSLSLLSIEDQIVFFKALAVVIRQSINAEIDNGKKTIENLQQRNMDLIHVIL